MARSASSRKRKRRSNGVFIEPLMRLKICSSVSPAASGAKSSGLVQHEESDLPISERDESDETRYVGGRIPCSSRKYSMNPGTFFDRLHSSASREAPIAVRPHRSAPRRRDQDALNHALLRGERLRAGSQAEPPPDFFQWDIDARFRTGQI